jgi:hypothetical protein
MPLVECPECGTEVSSLAAACPKCAFPIASALAKRGHPQAAERISKELPSGSRVPYTDQEVAVMLSRKTKTSHVLHFFLSLITLGLWLPVWLLVGILNSIGNDRIDIKVANGKKVR